MPFEMDFTVGGVNHPLSYWRIRFQSSNLDGITGHVVFFGYHDVASYDEFGADAQIGAEKRFDITDPAAYELCFGQGEYVEARAQFTTDISAPSYLGPSPFYMCLEGVARAMDSDFATAEWLSRTQLSEIEVGSAGPSAVVATFSRLVQLPSEEEDPHTFDEGVTIKINGVAATITGTEQTEDNIVIYTIAEEFDINDEVTWEYDSTTGFIYGDDGLKLQRFSPRTARNTEGEYLRFDDVNNSALAGAAA